MSEEVEMIRNEDQALERTDDPRRAEMKTPDDVSAMVRLKALGWGAKLTCPHEVVRVQS